MVQLGLGSFLMLTKYHNSKKWKQMELIFSLSFKTKDIYSYFLFFFWVDDPEHIYWYEAKTLVDDRVLNAKPWRCSRLEGLCAFFLLHRHQTCIYHFTCMRQGRYKVNEDGILGKIWNIPGTVLSSPSCTTY